MAKYQFTSKYPRLQVLWPIGSEDNIQFQGGFYSTDDEALAEHLHSLDNGTCVTVNPEALGGKPAAPSGDDPLTEEQVLDLIGAGIEKGVLERGSGGWIKLGDVSLGRSAEDFLKQFNAAPGLAEEIASKIAALEA